MRRKWTHWSLCVVSDLGNAILLRLRRPMCGSGCGPSGSYWIFYWAAPLRFGAAEIEEMCCEFTQDLTPLNPVIPLLQRGEGGREKRSFRFGKIPPKGGTTNFSFLALADRIDRSDRTAPLARRLASGVGSGVAVSRAIVGRMGPTRLAEQN